MNKYKVGQKYKVKRGVQMGNVIEITNVTSKRIEFKVINGSYDCAPSFDIGSMFDGYLELVDEKSETIVIYHQDNKVVALDKSTGKKAIARCNPEDTFDFKIGAKLAFDRLIGDKLPRLLNTKIVFVEGKYEFSANHIYEIKDGKIVDDKNSVWPLCNSFENIEEVKTYFVDMPFVEVKE